MRAAIFLALLGYAAAYSLESIVQNAEKQFAEQFGEAFPIMSLSDMKFASTDEFEDFIEKFEKEYKTAEEKLERFEIFATKSLIAQALQKNEQGTATYGLTKFSDRSSDEMKAYRGLKYPADYARQPVAETPKIEAADSVDWRTKGAVTPVKNQGQCGSCWAFSATENIEGQWFLKKGQLISLAERELVDCDTKDDGCDGGEMTTAFKQIEKLGGMVPEKDLPYKARDQKCSMNTSEIVAKISGYVTISQDETQMATWCAANGPISIGINAAVMEYYTGGISHPKKKNCSPEDLDHGVLIVGYGTEGTTPFWIIKNSWGADWGEDGYYRAFRGGGVCGLNLDCSSSTVA